MTTGWLCPKCGSGVVPSVERCPCERSTGTCANVFKSAAEWEQRAKAAHESAERKALERVAMIPAGARRLKVWL